MLDREALVDYIDTHYRQPGDRLFRLEQLPFYADNADTLARWRRGETEPDWDSDWSKILADEHDRGLIQQRVRVLSAQLTDDERASCLLAYPTNGRYEEIRILRDGEHPMPDLPAEDYWLITPHDADILDFHVLVMRYSDDGEFLGADVETDATHGAVAAALAESSDVAWKYAEPFHSWYPRHAPDLLNRKAA